MKIRHVLCQVDEQCFHLYTHFCRKKRIGFNLLSSQRYSLEFQFLKAFGGDVWMICQNPTSEELRHSL
uniref:Uncharacterized protein n=1 Tax=Salix viminalis TaxID=40686 RepID=A0A6N2K2H1_SALVM